MVVANPAGAPDRWTQVSSLRNIPAPLTICLTTTAREILHGKTTQLSPVNSQNRDTETILFHGSRFCEGDIAGGNQNYLATASLVLRPAVPASSERAWESQVLWTIPLESKSAQQPDFQSHLHTMFQAVLPLLGVDTWAQMLWLHFFCGQTNSICFCLFLASKYIPIATYRVVRFFPPQTLKLLFCIEV